MAESNPVKAKKKIAEGIEVLKALGLPKAQQNERSSLTLLALADLRPEARWSDACAPLRGVSEMMGFFEKHYGKKYAPNTRETVRRQTVHPFEQAGLVLRNPDAPKRPVNCPKTVYTLSPDALRAIREFATERRGRPSPTSHPHQRAATGWAR
jgi:adenine-specific DNA-methyltransferase